MNCDPLRFHIDESETRYEEAKQMSSIAKVFKERTTLISWLIAIVAGVIGGGLIYWTTFDYWNDKGVIREIVTGFGFFLLAPVAINILWQVFLRRAFVDELTNRFRVAEEVRSAGIIGYADHFYYDTEWASYFNNSNRLDMFFSYGRTWRAVNERNLEEFLKKGGAIRLVLPDPDHNETVSELARRYYMTEGDLRDSIKEALGFFEQLKSTVSNAKIDIWLLPKPPLFAFYRFDNNIIMTLFNHRPGRVGVPTIIIQRGGKLYDFISAEFDAMIQEGGLARRID